MFLPSPAPSKAPCQPPAHIPQAPAAWSWVSHSSPLSLSFVFCTVGIFVYILFVCLFVHTDFCHSHSGPQGLRRFSRPEPHMAAGALSSLWGPQLGHCHSGPSVAFSPIHSANAPEAAQRRAPEMPGHSLAAFQPLGTGTVRVGGLRNRARHKGQSGAELGASWKRQRDRLFFSF